MTAGTAGGTTLAGHSRVRLRHVARRVTRRGQGANPDLSQDYPRRQRRAVRLSSAVLLIGTAICAGVELVVSLPALVALLAQAAAEVGAGALSTLDGVVLIAVMLTWPVMWCAHWWARHKGQVRSLATRYAKNWKGGAAAWRLSSRYQRPARGFSRTSARSQLASASSTAWRRRNRPRGLVTSHEVAVPVTFGVPGTAIT